MQGKGIRHPGSLLDLRSESRELDDEGGMDEAKKGRRIGRRMAGNRRKSIREEMRKSERRNCEEDSDGQREGSRLKRQSFTNFVLKVIPLILFLPRPNF